MNTIIETSLSFLNDTYKFEDEARVASVITAEDGRTAVLLDRTIFYPQGGGQPADTGLIQSDQARFQVSDVRLVNGIVYHYGAFSQGQFTAGDTVHLSVSKDRRMLNARLHSAGHLIDSVVQGLGLDWKPSRGYHFPDSPYVEYIAKIDSLNKEELPNMLQSKARALIEQNLPIKVSVADRDQAEKFCGALPDYVDTTKPIRVVSIGDNLGCPCAGTHLKELKDMGRLEISKIRSKGDRIRVSYNIQDDHNPIANSLD